MASKEAKVAAACPNLPLVKLAKLSCKRMRDYERKRGVNETKQA